MTHFNIKNQVKKITSQLVYLFIFTIILCVFSVKAQDKKPNTILFDTCETGKLSLHTAGDDYKKDGKPNSYLLIVGGAMKGEKSSYTNQRIQQAIIYLNAIFNFGDRIVFGVGKSETHNGYLRFYVNGILRQEIITRKNAKLCWGEGDEMSSKINE